MAWWEKLSTAHVTKWDSLLGLLVTIGLLQRRDPFFKAMSCCSGFRVVLVPLPEANALRYFGLLTRSRERWHQLDRVVSCPREELLLGGKGEDAKHNIAEVVLSRRNSAW